MKRFKIFLSEAKNMIKLTKREWQKYEWRTDVFLRKYKAGEKFILYTNEKLIFKYEKQIYDRLKDGNINEAIFQKFVERSMLIQKKHETK